jgi:hypothetical protein
MDPWTIRTRALELAIGSIGATCDADILRRAAAFAEFIANGDRSTRAKIDAALDAAGVK